MNDALITALAALGGSAVGAVASFATTHFTLHVQDRARRVAQAISRKENLYGEFIEEASRLFGDALTHKLDDASKLVRLYALMSKLRLFASPKVLLAADDVIRRIIATYERPEKNPQILKSEQDYDDLDILRAFSAACREELDL